MPMNLSSTSQLAIILLLLSQTVFSQPLDILKADTMDANNTYPRYTFMEVRGHYGQFLPTNEILSNSVAQNPWYALDIRFGWKGYGTKKWQSYFSYPSYGLGWFSCYFNPRDNVVGNPNAIYVWYNQPIVKVGFFSFNAELDFGLSYDFYPYDSLSNPSQTVIGSKRNVFFNPSFEGAFRLSERLDFSVGLNFVHFSNGRIKTPQRGMNLAGLSGKVRYNFRPYTRRHNVQKSLPIRPVNIPHDKYDLPLRWEFSFILNAGYTTPKHYSEFKATHFWVATLGLDALRHYTLCTKIGLGVDLFYDGSIAEEKLLLDGTEFDDVQAIDKFVFGVHFGHELMVHRWTLITQLGTNLNQRYYKGIWFARVGLRYDLTRNIFLRIALKTQDKFQADFIEWGGGVSLYKIKKE